MIYPAGATSVSVDVQFLDDTGAAVTGKVAADFPACKWSGGGNTADTTITMSDLAAITTAHPNDNTAGGVKEREGGWYRLDLPNNMLTAAGMKRLTFAETTNKRILAPLVAVGPKVDVDTIKTQAVTCAAPVTIRADVGAAAAPGAANGMLIGGSNAATTFAGLTTGALSCTTITASGAVAFQSTFTVTTSTSLAALSATTVTFSGAVAFQSTFVVTTSTSLGALSCTTLTASGAVAFQSTFIVTGAVTFSSTFATTGTTTFNAFTVTNALTVSGTTTLTGAVSLGSTLGVTGTVTFNAFTCTNNFTVSGNWLTTGTTTWTGAAAFGSTFTITGNIVAANLTNTRIGYLDNINNSTLAGASFPTDPADASDIAGAFSTVNSTLATIAGYIDTEVATIVSGVANIQTRLPAALVSGRMDASVGAYQSGMTPLRILASGTAQSGDTTSLVDSARTEADASYWKGARIVFTSGNLLGQHAVVTAFDEATDTLTFAPALTQAVATHTYELWPAKVDVEGWNGSKVTSSVASSTAYPSINIRYVNAHAVNDTSGYLQVDVGRWATEIVPGTVATGVPTVNTKYLIGTAFTESALGRLVAGFKKFFDVVTPASTMELLTAVTTVTNLTNAPTAGDFTADMKTSLNAATPVVTVSDKTGFSLANGSFVTATFGTCDFTSTQKASITAAVPTAAVIAAATEAAILNEGDATALLAAIAAKVEEFLINEGDATATLAAIAAAVRTNLATELGRIDVAVSTRGTSTLTQTQVTGGAYSVQSASCVLGDARIANLDAAVTTRQVSIWAAANSTVNLSGTTVKTATDVEADTQDIQSRLPAALTGAGNMKADALAIDGSTTAATAQKNAALALHVGTVTGAATTTTLIDSSLTMADADQIKGRIVIFVSGGLIKEATDITAFDPATDEITFTALTNTPQAGDAYVIV